MINNPQQLAARTLDTNTHSSLLGDKSLFYLMNGDITAPEANNADLFVQNHLSNELCFQFPTGYQYCGNIQLNSFEYLLCFKTPTSSEIGTFNVSNCNYSTVVNSPCLNFDPNHPVRGVFKNKSDNNDRRVYFIDTLNKNRFLDIDQAYPRKLLSNFCDSCEKVYSNELDCDKLQMFRNVKPPQLVIRTQRGGNLNSGVYQVAIAFGEDDVPLTDYYFSPVVKLFSENSDIYLDIDIKCVGEQIFPQMFIKLVTNTRESSLVVYSIGTFNSNQSKLSISNLSNSTVFSTSQVIQKSIAYDYSEHIATNGETLLLGKHKLQEPLNYQIQANNIRMRWAEVKVKGKDAYNYPVFMRDEVYPFGIEWFDLKGRSRGIFHIPGRAPETISLFDRNLGSFVNKLETDISPEEYWQDKDVNCNFIPAKIYEVMNTAQITNTYGVICQDCVGPDLRNFISKKGKMGYNQSKDYYYPSNEDVWGSLACQPIRHHRIPSHDKTHVYGELNSDTWEINPNECVNLMTIFPENIEHPKLPNGTYDPDIRGYRILWGDRIGTGNKSILHKGFLVSGRVERFEQPNLVTDIIYPNYPYNDENPDPFLSTTQTNDWGGTENFTAANINSFQDQFYYSPDIFYRETRNEIGTFITKYAEEIGTINGKITPTYLHPSVALGKPGNPIDKGLKTFAFQINSVSNFTKAFTQNSLSNFSYYDNYFIDKAQYLLPIKQKVILDDMGTEVKINNLYRDYNYYFRLNRNLIKVKEDVTRVLASEIDCPSATYDPVFYTSSDLVTRNGTLKPIQSTLPFIGVKIRTPNQYGSLEDIKYIPCNQPITTVPPSDSYTPDIVLIHSSFHIGGDVYISKHSITRRFPIFTNWLYDVPFDTETDYRERRNIYKPRFWYDNLTKAEDQWNLDCQKLYFPTIRVDGKFYTSVNGILSFYLESEFIGNYRETSTDPNGSFYPKSDPDDLFQSDIFKLSEKFLYNIALLNGSIESGYQDITPTESKADYTVIVSQKDDAQSAGDKWLQFLPSNYTILPRIYGAFTGIHYTDMYSLFFMFENEILYSQINFTLNTNEGNGILLNQGDIFSNRLQKLSNEQTGYCGSIDPLSFINTRYGTFFVDRFRKKVFLWKGGLQDVTGTMSSWLNKYMIDKEYSYTDSIISVYDNFTGNVYFTENVERYLTKFTLSYKPAAQGWNSFHSFTPQAYLCAPNTYLSIVPTGIWKHNKLYEYQRYYGIQYPFDVGILISNQFTNAEFQSIEVFTEWIKYQGYGEEIYVKSKFFDKVFAYNNNGSTGIMPTFLKTKGNPSHSLLQNAENPSYIMEVTQVNDSIYRLNKLQSYKQDTSTPMVTMSIDGTSYSPNSINPNINPTQREDIKGKWLKLHLISDTNYENKILVQLISPNIHPISK